MKHRIAILLSLAMMSAGLAEAGPYTASSRAERWEFSLQTRYAWSQTIDTGRGTKVDFEDDLGWGFGFGYNVSEQLNLGFAFAWRSLHYTATGASATDPTDTWTYGNVLDTSTFGLTGDYTFGLGRFSPYLAGNLGWMLINTNIVGDVDVGCWYDPFLGYVCTGYTSTYGTDAFTYGLGLGLRVDLSPAAFLRVGWDHNWNDLDAMDSNDLLRVDLGFLM
jgi:opacity protein-like surface antigen